MRHNLYNIRITAVYLLLQMYKLEDVRPGKANFKETLRNVLMC